MTNDAPSAANLLGSHEKVAIVGGTLFFDEHGERARRSARTGPSTRDIHTREGTSMPQQNTALWLTKSGTTF